MRRVLQFVHGGLKASKVMDGGRYLRQTHLYFLCHPVGRHHQHRCWSGQFRSKLREGRACQARLQCKGGSAVGYEQTGHGAILLFISLPNGLRKRARHR